MLDANPDYDKGMDTQSPPGAWRDDLRPRLRQAWLNLQVWTPGLANPDARSRQVRYTAREHRSGLRWRIALPEQCWHCGQTNGIRGERLEFVIRAFERPLTINAVGGALVALLLLLAVAWLSWFLFLLAGATLGASVGLLLIKSWREDIEAVIWCCADHCPKSTSIQCSFDDDELVLFAPTAALAEAVRDEITAKRRGKAAYPSQQTGSVRVSAVPENRAISRADDVPFGLAREELPPIPLDEAAGHD